MSVDSVIKKVAEQQTGKEIDSESYCIGETLKAIATASIKAAEILDADLDIPEMSIDAAATFVSKERKKKADSIYKETHKSPVVIPPKVSYEILCSFYGIHDVGFDTIRDGFSVDGEKPNSETIPNLAEKSKKRRVNLEDFI